MVCTLHLLLSVTKTLFHNFIRCSIFKQSVADEVNAILKELNVCAKKIMPLARGNAKPGRPMAFTGPECIRILESMEKLLSIVHEKVEDELWLQR